MPDTNANECLSFMMHISCMSNSPARRSTLHRSTFLRAIIPYDACMQYIESKLALIPRFLQRVVTPPFGPPIWQNDPNFDVRNHVREITLKRGTEAEWKSAASQILSTHLERSRPLWDITLFHGLKGNPRASWSDASLHGRWSRGSWPAQCTAGRKFHSPSATPQETPCAGRSAADPGTVLLDGLISSCFSTAQVMLTAHSELLRMAQQVSHPTERKSRQSPAQRTRPGRWRVSLHWRFYPSSFRTYAAGRAPALQCALPRAAEVRVGGISDAGNYGDQAGVRRYRE